MVFTTILHIITWLRQEVTIGVLVVIPTFLATYLADLLLQQRKASFPLPVLLIGAYCRTVADDIWCQCLADQLLQQRKRPFFISSLPKVRAKQNRIIRGERS